MKKLIGLALLTGWIMLLGGWSAWAEAPSQPGKDDEMNQLTLVSRENFDLEVGTMKADIASIAGLKTCTRTEGEYVKAKDGSIGTDSRFDVIEFDVSNCSFVRCTLDGTIPTSSAGFALYADGRFVSGHPLEGGRSLYLLDVDESITQIKMTVLAGKGYSVALGKNINDIQQEVDALSQQVEKAADAVTRIAFAFADENAYLTGDGRVVPHNSYRYTDFVALKPFTKVVFPAFFSSGARCILYDAGKNVISSITNEVEGTVIELDVPDNCYYMRFSCKKNKAGDFYIRTEDSIVSRLSDMFIKEAVVDDVPLSTIIQDGGYTKIFRTMGVIGDSLASGEMAYSDSVDESTRHYVDMYEYSWIQYMARYCGSKAINFSRGGMNTATFRRDSSEQYQSFIDPENKCQAYFIALGHNDYNGEVPVGTLDDALPDYTSNPRTFYGNYDWIIHEIKRIQPKAKIFLVNMKNDALYHDYNAAISELAAKYAGQNVYLLDMAQYAPALDSSWEYTKGHGNTMGYLNYSYQISSYVDWIIRHNRGDFKNVQFIGTDYE